MQQILRESEGTFLLNGARYAFLQSPWPAFSATLTENLLISWRNPFHIRGRNQERLIT